MTRASTPRGIWLRHLNIPVALAGCAAFAPEAFARCVAVTLLLTVEWPLCFQLSEGVEVYLPVSWASAAAAYVLGPMVLPVVWVSATLGFFLIDRLDRAGLVAAKGLAREGVRRWRGEPFAPGSDVDGLLRQFTYLGGHVVRVTMAGGLPADVGLVTRVALAESCAILWLRFAPAIGRWSEAEVRQRLASALGREALVATGVLHVAMVAFLLVAERVGGLIAFVTASLSTTAVHAILWGLNQSRLESEERGRALVAMREELDRRQRLAAIGQTASMIFHQVGRQHGVIGMFAHLIERGPGPHEGDWVSRAREHATRILTGVEGANRVIDELLRFSEERSLNLYPQSLAELVAECREECRPRALRSGVMVEVSVEGDVVVAVDKHKLKQAVGNLLDNAIEASRPQGEVRVRVAAGDGAAWMSGNDRQPSLAVSRVGPTGSTRGLSNVMGMKPNGSTASPPTNISLGRSSWSTTETSTTVTCRATPTCWAARPTPWAAYIVASRSAANSRRASFTSPTARPGLRRMGSSYLTTGRILPPVAAVGGGASVVVAGVSAGATSSVAIVQMRKLP